MTSPGPAPWLALFRAVNLPGHNKVPMAALRELAVGLGLEEPRTLLQTGNLVFRSPPRPAPELEALLEEGARDELGLDTDIFVRSASGWNALLAANPFPEAAAADPAHLVVLALKDEVAQERVDALREAIRGREVVQAVGRHAWAVYPDGIGRSRLTTALIERKLGTAVTGRNWNTALKLAALLSS